MQPLRASLKQKEEDLDEAEASKAGVILLTERLQISEMLHAEDAEVQHRLWRSAATEGCLRRCVPSSRRSSRPWCGN